MQSIINGYCDLNLTSFVDTIGPLKTEKEADFLFFHILTDCFYAYILIIIFPSPLSTRSYSPPVFLSPSLSPCPSPSHSHFH